MVMLMWVGDMPATSATGEGLGVGVAAAGQSRAACEVKQSVSKPGCVRRRMDGHG